MSTRTAPPRSLLGIDDLSGDDVDALLSRARELIAHSTAIGACPFVAGLVFQSSSLRTRVGFKVAAARLGGSVVDVAELRDDTTMSSPESFADTLRIVQGMVDVTVTRTVAPLNDLVELERISPVINGGESGGEHPTQALIDLLAMEEEAGAVKALRIGVCGDLGARSVRSLIKLLSRRTPASLLLMAPANRPLPEGTLTGELKHITEEADHLRCDGLDVLYMVGLPEGRGEEALDASARARFSLGEESIRELPSTAVVLSPMPVIDEIDFEVRDDPRMRMFAQSDRGVAVRIACLELCLGLAPF